MLEFLEELRNFIRLVAQRMRARVLVARGAQIGEKTNIGCHVVVDRPWAVFIGIRATIEDDVYLKIVANRACLNIGDHSFIGKGCEFDVLEKIDIGKHVLIAPG